MEAYKQKNMKDHNKNLLLNILKLSKVPLTKRQLSEKSNLSVVTINKSIPELVDSNEIIELDEPVKTGGRFAQVYQFNADRELFIVVQFIEKEKKITIQYYVVNLLGMILDQRELVANQLRSFIQELSKIKKKFPQISLSIIGIPGVEIKGKLKIMDSNCFKEVNLTDEIKKSMDIKVIIENDINAATFGYSTNGTDIVSGIYFPNEFPPGASLIIHQKIFKGFNNLSGEIKHLPCYTKFDTQFSDDDFQNLLLETIQSVIALYDPQELVLYLSETKLPLINEKEIETKLTAIFPYNVLPKLKFSSTFSHNYLTGLIRIGIEHIQ